MVYLFEQVSPSVMSGLGYILRLFRAALPGCIPVRNPQEIENLPANSILVYPRVFNYDPVSKEFVVFPDVHATFMTNATVIGSFFWESPVLPLKMIPAIGFAHHLHVPSTFLLNVFKHPRAFYFPPPVKDFPKREKAPKSKKIGLVIASLHVRKNISLVNELARRLPRHQIIVVGAGDANVRNALLSEISEPNTLVWFNISEADLCQFYHSLDWFVVLSGGEGYCLPAREALQCGVPVIAPRHTAFLDLEGVPGVFFVNARPCKYPTWGDDAIYYTFSVDEIAEIIQNTEPPEPSNVVNPTPCYDRWEKFWWDKLKEVNRERVRLSVRVREVPALFGEYHEQPLCGINVAVRGWVQKTGSARFNLWADKPVGYNGVIVIPFHEYGVDANTLLNPLRAIRKNNPNAKVVLWVHFFHFHQTVFRLLPYIDKVAATTKELLDALTLRSGDLVLPNPIGNPAKCSETEDYWLAWGFNRSQYPFLLEFAKHFNQPILLLSPLREIVEDWVLNLPGNVRARFDVYLSDDELDEIADKAIGFLCFDFHIPHIRGEASGKIPFVLRKGKPIVANSAPRTIHYRDYIELVHIPLNIQEAVHYAHLVAEKVVGAPHLFVPKNIPSMQTELQLFNEFILKCKGGLKQ